MEKEYDYEKASRQTMVSLYDTERPLFPSFYEGTAPKVRRESEQTIYSDSPQSLRSLPSSVLSIRKHFVQRLLNLINEGDEETQYDLKENFL